MQHQHERECPASQPQQNGGLSTVREAPPPPVPKEDTTKPKRGANLTEVEGRATGGQLHGAIVRCRLTLDLYWLCEGCSFPCLLGVQTKQ